MPGISRGLLAALRASPRAADENPASVLVTKKPSRPRWRWRSGLFRHDERRFALRLLNTILGENIVRGSFKSFERTGASRIDL